MGRIRQNGRRDDGHRIRTASPRLPCARGAARPVLRAHLAGVPVPPPQPPDGHRDVHLRDRGDRAGRRPAGHVPGHPGAGGRSGRQPCAGRSGAPTGPRAAGAGRRRSGARPALQAEPDGVGRGRAEERGVLAAPSLLPAALPVGALLLHLLGDVLDPRLGTAGLPAVALDVPRVPRPAGHPDVGRRPRQRPLSRRPRGHRGHQRRRAAAGAGRAVGDPRADAGGPGHGRTGCWGPPRSPPGSRSWSRTAGWWWTPRRPICAASSAICTTARRPGWSRSPWTWGWPRRSWRRTRRPPRGWWTRHTAR